MVVGRTLLVKTERGATLRCALAAGVDDPQDACKGCPNSNGSALWPIITYYDSDAGIWMCVEHFGHSYGRGSSVNNFNEWPEPAVAFARRHGAIMTLHYVGGFPIADLDESEKTAQGAMAMVTEVVGTPFAEEKLQEMGVCPTLPGLVNDLSEAPTRHEAILRATPERAQKVVSVVEVVREAGQCTPEYAAKLRGPTQAYGGAVQGMTARGCSQALVEVQYGQGDDVSVTSSARNALEYIESVVRLAPSRAIPGQSRRPVAAVMV